MTADDLLGNLLRSMQTVQASGFKVLAVIADNNAVNRKIGFGLSGLNIQATIK
jgi:hypothetical protein